MDASIFQSRTADLYARIRAALDDRPDQHLVRMWNFIPGILAPLKPFRQRYMAFNAGRFEAFDDWFHGTEQLHRCVPTSSGVGHDGSDLVVHALTCDQPGMPVENSRQVPSYLYSRRYGLRPPCFSRATRLNRNAPRSPLLLVGGTASVVGESTVHEANLPEQFDETCTNLATLVRAGLPEPQGAPSSGDPLDAFRFLRVYYTRQEDEEAIARMVRDGFTGLQEVEYVKATLCRPGLSVEIEGVATVDCTFIRR